jgi:hypothetical protein
MVRFLPARAEIEARIGNCACPTIGMTSWRWRFPVHCPAAALGHVVAVNAAAPLNTTNTNQIQASQSRSLGRLFTMTGAGVMAAPVTGHQ